MLQDFDTAYDNMKAISDSATYPPRWTELASGFRAKMRDQGRLIPDIAYAEGTRNHYDLFLPEGTAKGTLVYVHGGYWKGLDKSFWSHLAQGALTRGYRVAMPSYTLCPEARISGITLEIGRFIDRLAQEVDGDIALTGHSAGGHLVSRMACENAPIAAATAERISHVLSISGLHDLRPLLKTAMNDIFHMDAEEAVSESAALQRPRADIAVHCCVGGDELMEFRRQNALLANIWYGLGIETSAWEIDGTHHCDVIDTLCDPESRAVKFLCP
ncbi:alpha/beta hydrolase [Brucella haematophila]|uniref:alpha/beta hydrolase n=1 Tax=Brucella haematophila TaxID=419474 RepID=UPI00110DC983|nr:alpha/beta hydrolase [Brucella haematophila]TMV00800.1 alpha/beta hydrolase [Brucella haematophila]